MLLNWATPRERGPGLLNCKKTNVKERKTEGIKLFPGHAQDMGKSETTVCTFSSPAIFNQGQPWKNSLREKKVLNVGRQINFQKKRKKRRKKQMFRFSTKDLSEKIAQTNILNKLQIQKEGPFLELHFRNCLYF